MEKKRKTSEARRRANNKWDAKNLKRLSLAMPIQEYESLERHIANTGDQRNTFIRESIKEKIERDT